MDLKILVNSSNDYNSSPSLSQTLTFLLNFRPSYQTAYLTSSFGYLIDNSDSISKSKFLISFSHLLHIAKFVIAFDSTFLVRNNFILLCKNLGVIFDCFLFPKLHTLFANSVGFLINIYTDYDLFSPL